MKKIVGILLAGAMAFSAFAADVSAKVNLEGELLNITDGAVNALSINKPSDQHWNPIMNFAVNGDQAGAEFAVFTGSIESAGGWNKGFGVHANRFKIWMSPFAGFKFIFGLNGFNLNQETITYSKTDSGVEAYGYGINYSNSGFSLDLAFLPNGSGSHEWGASWFAKPKDGDVSIGGTALKAEYAADFGKINGILYAASTFKDLKFGLGYSNNFSGINMFANVLGYVNDGFNKLRVELFANGNVDAFSWAVFVAPNMGLAGDFSMDLQLVAKAAYNFGSVNAYLLIGENASNIGLVNNKAFELSIQPGVDGNIGGAGWNVGLRLNLAKPDDMTVKFAIPVSISMGW